MSILPPLLGAAAPILLLAAALPAALRPGRRPGRLPLLAEATAAGAAGLSLLTALLTWFGGTAVLALGQGGPVLLRFDAIGTTMALLVGFVGWVVIRYARTYLDGEPREGLFHALTLLVLAGVLVLAQAGNLWVLVGAFLTVGAGLRQLLLFYRARPEARRAATKFALVWGAGDLALIVAAVLLWQGFGTSDLAAITTEAQSSGLPPLGGLAVAAMVLAALLKTAAFPLHGWLTEVMEAPTPVSALLHAGVINAGGVMLIKLAPLVQASPGAMAALVMAGGITALFGAVVMLTQSAVKTALAWSTVAQMGFMLLQCGLGLWSLALLHIVAHSLYKAHAFLSSGGAVRAVASVHRPGPVAVPGLHAVGRSFLAALVLYIAVAGAFALMGAPKTPQALALGAMLIFGVAYLVAQGLADSAPAALTQRTVIASSFAAIAYFGFHALAGLAWGAHLPAAPVPGALEWGLIVLTVLSFGLVAFAQALFPLWAHHPASAGLRVHLANGLYLNAVLDRLIGGFRAAQRN